LASHVAGHPGPRHLREMAMISISASQHYELRFQSLFDEGRGMAFPCDVEGRVDMDGLPPRALGNYLYARTVIGREFATPVVRPAALN
jgi:hypothetical protein